MQPKGIIKILWSRQKNTCHISFGIVEELSTYDLKDFSVYNLGH